MADRLDNVINLLDYKYISEWPAGIYTGPESDGDGRTHYTPWPQDVGNISDLPIWRLEDDEPEVRFDLDVLDVMLGLHELLVSKQKDYGPHAISRSPGGAIHGINVRMHDKLSRAVHLLTGGAQPGNESLLDTYRDLANYAVIAVLVLEEKWPE